MVLRYLARCMATEEEAVCLSHDGDSRCLNCILGRKAGETSKNDSSHKPNEQKGCTYIFGMFPAQVLPTAAATITTDPAWVFPGPGWYLLSLLDSIKINLQYVAVQPTNQQCAAVSQQETVHVITLVQPVGDGKG